MSTSPYFGILHIAYEWNSVLPRKVIYKKYVYILNIYILNSSLPPPLRKSLLQKKKGKGKGEQQP